MFTLPEPLGIDPRVDLVFAWLFGQPDHEAFRLDFLNAVLAGGGPRITRAIVTNPVHPGDFEGHRELRVDVEVTDESGHTYQIEMQRQVRQGLQQRMLYGWARLYAAQTRQQASYRQLRPVFAIWVCEEEPFPRSASAHLRFRVREEDEGLPLHDDLRIDVIQLSRAKASGTGLEDIDLGRWCRFLNEASNWRSLPAEVYTSTLESAMRAIDTFRTDAQLNALYQARRNFQLEFSAEIAEIEELRGTRLKLEALRAENEVATAQVETERAAKEVATAQVEAERAAKQVALTEVARLTALLAARGPHT